MMIPGVGSSSHSLLCLLLLQSFQIGIHACAFRCGDGSCINTLEICNGQKDCTDGSDETREVCAVLPCKNERNAFGRGELSAEQGFGPGDEGMSFVGSLSCEYRGCITTNFKCNGISNCVDNSHETAEVCKDINCNANSFRCDSGVCISRYDVCDDVINCQDGSDEIPENCKFRASIRRVVCPKRTKKYCDNRRECYQRRKECDGIFDCADKSDEKAELCHRATVVVTPPSPTTSPTTATDTSASMVRCTAREAATGMSVDVLSCGDQALASCVDRNEEVPPTTVVYADCWGVSSATMRCHRDGNWTVNGAHISGSDDVDSKNSPMEGRRMKRLCQPHYVNSPVCGRRSRYKSTGGTIHLENRWPMVMALKKSGRYICSATLISPRFLLTAGHCVVVSKESNQKIDVGDLMVQKNMTERNLLRVSEIILHPAYEPGQKPLNDLALIRLRISILFNSKMYPACVDLEGLGFRSTHRAVTFNLTYGENQFSYDEILQQIDPGCYDRTNRCTGLRITEKQFCGVDLEKKRFLERGSSGGPYLQNFGSDDSEKWTVAGVVSFSVHQHTCRQNYTVFTAVNDYATWITDLVK